MSTGAGEGRDRWYRNVIAENDWSRAGPAAASIKDDVVNTYSQGCVNVLFDMLRTQLIPNGYAAGSLTDFVGEFFNLACLSPLGETRRRDRRCAW